MGEGEEVRTYHDVLIDFENNNNSNNKALVPKFGVGYGSSTDYFGSSRSLINFHYYYFFGNVCVGCTEKQHLPKKKKGVRLPIVYLSQIFQNGSFVNWVFLRLCLL